MAYNDAAQRLIDTLSEDEPGAKLDELAKTGFFHENIPPFGKMYDMRGSGYKHPWPHTLQVVDQTRLDDSHRRAISDFAQENGVSEDRLVDFQMLILKVSALTHDLGKTEAIRRVGRDISFPQHQFISASMAKRILMSLGFDKPTAEAISRDCYLHHSISPDRIEGNELDDAISGRKAKHSKIEKLVADLSGEDPLNVSPQGSMDLQRRLSLIEADASSLVDWKRDYVAKIRAEIEKAAEVRRLEQDAIRENAPVLDGKDLMNIFGLPPGRWIGEAHKLLTEDKKKHPDQDKARAVEIIREFLARRS